MAASGIAVVHATLPKNDRAWWEQKLQRNEQCGRETDEWLLEAGWMVERVWEHE
jgi:DNA mismatch endonuclease (patch repair protein)